MEKSTVKLTYHSLVMRMKSECCCNDWQDGVLKYFDGCSQSAKEFPKPSAQAENVMSTFEIFLNKLIDLTTSNSTILSSRATATLEAMSMLSKMGGSPGNLLNESMNTLPQLSDDLMKIISSLSENIGQLTTHLMNDAITDLQHSIMHFGMLFRKSGVEHFGNGLGTKADYEPVTICAQVLMNTIALIAETTLDDCKIATPDIFESLIVLTLISNWYLIGVHSVNVCAQGILHSTSQLIPDKLYVSLVTIGPFLQPMAHAIDGIGNALVEELADVLTSLVSITISFNSKLFDLFGQFEGVASSVGQITDTLLTAINKAR